MKITVEELGNDYRKFHCENQEGCTVDILNLGGIIQNFILPSGKDVVLGYDNPSDYLKNTWFVGTAVGRFANRISNSSFLLEGKTYHLEANDGKNNLHSGNTGLHTKIFSHKITQDALILSAVLPALEGGFPGEISLDISYQLELGNRLVIDYLASTDAPSPINLTNHSYFNLNSLDSTCLDQELQLKADYFTVNNREMIPTGEIRAVDGTPFDFRQGKKIGEDLNHESLANTNGYDVNYIVNQEKNLKTIAIVRGNTIKMEVESNSPCVQFYTGGFLETHQGKNGVTYGKHSGFCLETGTYPNAINQPAFPNCVLKPGELWQYRTIFSFSETL